MSDLDLEIEEDELIGEGSEVEFTSESDEAAGTSTKKRGRGKTIRPPLVSCHKCRRPYYSLPGYTKHLKTHLLKDLYAAAPGHEASLEFCRKASRDILEEIRSIPVAGGLGLVDDVKTTVQTLLSLDDLSLFVDIVTTAIEECLPSSSWNSVADLNNLFATHINAVLNSDVKCKAIKDALSEIISVEVSEEVLEWIVARFFNKLCCKFESFYLQCLKEPLECLLSYSSRSDAPIDNNNPDDVDFQRSVHYVSGSCVKSVLDLSFRSRSKSWLCIRNTIQCKMLAGELVNGPCEQIESWTRRRDRGGLKFVSDSVYVFFMALTGIIKNVAGADGSVLHEDVLNRVKDDYVLMLLWDNVVQGSLSEEDSDILLKNMLQKFVNAWGHGETLRRKNAVALLSTDKAPLRSKLSK